MRLNIFSKINIKTWFVVSVSAMYIIFFSTINSADAAYGLSDGLGNGGGGYLNTHFGKGLSLHKQNFFLPLTYADDNERTEEVKFQFSLKQQIGESNFYFAYTQKSFWRVLDDDDSRPFRETNYNPEIFYRFPLTGDYADGLAADIGIEHESNGARVGTSRSWNKVYFSMYSFFGSSAANIKVWYRIEENENQTSTTNPSGDDNPDIDQYYSPIELTLVHEFPYKHQLRISGGWNQVYDRGSIQVDYSFPTPGDQAFFFLHYFSGYGESMIDYDRRLIRAGAGIMFKR